jgi:Mg2+ and Co2+ transporter CorA
MSPGPGATFRSPAELLAQLLRDQANVLVEIVRHSTGRVDTIEDKLLGNRIAASRAELGLLRRMLVRLQPAGPGTGGTVPVTEPASRLDRRG